MGVCVCAPPVVGSVGFRHLAYLMFEMLGYLVVTGGRPRVPSVWESLSDEIFATHQLIGRHADMLGKVLGFCF